MGRVTFSPRHDGTVTVSHELRPIFASDVTAERQHVVIPIDELTEPFALRLGALALVDAKKSAEE